MKHLACIAMTLSAACSLPITKEGGPGGGDGAPDAATGSDSPDAGSACSAPFAGIWRDSEASADPTVFRLIADNAWVSSGITGVHWTQLNYRGPGGYSVTTSLDAYASANGTTLSVPQSQQAVCSEIDVSYVDACGAGHVSSFHPTPGTSGGCLTDSMPATTQCDPATPMTIDGVAAPGFTRACNSTFAYNPGEYGTTLQYAGWPMWRYSDLFGADYPGSVTGDPSRTYLAKTNFISLEIHAMDLASFQIIGTDTYEDPGLKVSISTQPGHFSKFVRTAFPGTDGVDPSVVCECDDFATGCFHITDNPADTQYASTNCKLDLGATYYLNFTFANDSGTTSCTASGVGFAGECRIDPTLYTAGVMPTST